MLNQLRRRDRGSIALEMAIALPVMVLTVFGLYDTTRVLTTWSRGAQTKRPCGNLKAGSDARMDQIPAGMMKISGFFVADISFTYRPLFLGFFKTQFKFMTSSYLPPRSYDSAPVIDFYPLSDRNLTYCP